MNVEHTASSDWSVGPELVGRSPQLKILRERIPFVARAQRTTLISGPTGSGKDVIARTLHGESPRRSQPYVTVHCAALPETLVEAEMFGHSRGAFTGATQKRDGLIRTASHGTLFLDEIDSLPSSAQAKLLRFLETGEYRAVGSDQVEQSDAWVITATNQDLEDRVRRGLFRADLMFRLAVVTLDMPPLAKRPEDILELAEHFLRLFTQGSKSFAEEARRALLAYEWPGNVRELRHRVEAAAIFTESPVIDSIALNLGGARRGPDPVNVDPPLSPDVETSALARELWRLVDRDRLSLAEAMDRCERVLLEAALHAEGENRTRAANRLGIHVRTMFKKLSD
jgi:DNA-binding NtrC family response regulator